MMPRSAAGPRWPRLAMAWSTMSGWTAWTTSAAVGAVRPQPVSSGRRPRGAAHVRVDADGEQGDPAQPVDLQPVVPEGQLLGGGPGPRVEEADDVEEGDGEGHDGELEPDGVVAGVQLGRPLEGPQAVGGDRHRGRQGPDRAEEGRRVGPERLADRPVVGSVVVEQLLLPRPLARHDEQRTERGHDEEPVGQGHAGGHAAGHRPQDEPGADGGQVEDGLVLQPEGVGHVDEGVDGDDQGQVPAGQQPAEARPTTASRPTPRPMASGTGTTPAATGPEALGGVEPVGRSASMASLRK